jgi:hypothetical protein
MADPILPTACDFHVKCQDLLHDTNLQHGTYGFTSPPKEGVQRIFFTRNIRQLQPGLNPQTWVPEASVLTTRPLKSLYHFLVQLEHVTLSVQVFKRGTVHTVIFQIVTSSSLVNGYEN